MNVNEFGNFVAFDVSFNIAGATLLEMWFWKPDNPYDSATNTTPSLQKTAAIGTVDLETTAGLFSANEYAKYQWADGDVDQAGLWTARVVYRDLTQRLTSLPASFTVAL